MDAENKSDLQVGTCYIVTRVNRNYLIEFLTIDTELCARISFKILHLKLILNCMKMMKCITRLRPSKEEKS